jgi:hypothetical protein|tara:strand:- start:283 stop:645 length:363 start_codon:yes stop_codon:yes gene_type:complete
MNYIVGLTIIGIISGLFAGIIGGGAEILIVPLLTLFGLLGSLKSRIGTSLFMILPPIGLFAALKFYKKGHVDVFAALYMGIIFTIFASFTSFYTINLDEKVLKKIFGIFTIVSGVYIYFK